MLAGPASTRVARDATTAKVLSPLADARDVPVKKCDEREKPMTDVVSISLNRRHAISAACISVAFRSPRDYPPFTPRNA